MNGNVRTFRAPSMPEALAAIKRELGPDAVILGTRTLPANGVKGWARRQRVEITAAPPGVATVAPRASGVRKRAAAAATTEPTPSVERPAGAALGPHLYPHYIKLVENEVAEELAARLVRRAAADLPSNATADAAALNTAVRDYIARMVPQTPGINLQPGQMRRVALLGPSGAGKSTTLAKLAALFKLRHNVRVGLLSLDMHRLDAHVQLQRYAEVLQVPAHGAQTIAEVKQALRALEDVELVLIDTPGVGFREQARFARLATLLRAARPDETHLVLPASLDPKVQARMAQAFGPLNVSKVVLTRLDDAVGFGVIVNVIERLGLGVSYLATGQNVPNDLQEACGGHVAELVFSADE